MDKTHFLQLLQQRLRNPTHFEFPESLRPAVDSLAQAIQDLPIAPEMRGGLLGGLLNVCEYIDQACRHFMPTVAPVPPPAPVSEPEPTPVAEQSDPAGEAVSEPVTGGPAEQVAEQAEQVAEQQPDKPAA